ncbi:hypothetical protein B0J18DRAFT_455729 [Chaetomium sp. MPI-SDFR-AT-0129]|nr:hypothetical protein B0J18DRAFT_455729 [Chaetomium sp. MPI-SDFR-AT-0129]
MGGLAFPRKKGTKRFVNTPHTIANFLLLQPAKNLPLAHQMSSTTANDVPIEGMAQMILGRDDEKLAETFVKGFHLGSDNGYARAREETFLAAAEAMDHRLQSEALPAADRRKKSMI